MSPASAQHLLNLRVQSRSLTDSVGWTTWALPELRKLLREKQAAILNDATLRGDDLTAARAEFRALNGFLTKLHSDARAAFGSILPGTLPEETAEQVMPDPSVRDAILRNLSFDPFRAAPNEPITSHQAPGTRNQETSFTPFSGLPQPPQTHTP